MIPLSDTTDVGDKFPFWVLVIIGINIYVFYLELTNSNPDLFISHFALLPNLINFNHLSTLKPFITSQFLHAGFLHIISNMWFLWIFGDNVENYLGKLLFPTFYLFCGIIGGLVQYSLDPTSSVPTLGASGAIAGVLGGYFGLFPDHKIKTLIPIFGLPAILDIPASIMLLYWFITQIFSGSISLVSSNTNIGGVAFFAHIGGFITGWILTKLISKVHSVNALIN